MRLRLLASVERQELSLGELADALGESLPNVSRHATQLRTAGLLSERRLGTRAFVRLSVRNGSDAVLEDALEVGRGLCDESGVFARVQDILKRRDARTLELLGLDQAPLARGGVADETPLYLAALRGIVPARDLVIDVSPVSGAHLDVLAPIFRRVVVLEPPAAGHPSRAERHAELRGYANVEVIFGDARSEQVRARLSGAADVLLASSNPDAERAPIAALALLLKKGGRLIWIETDARTSAARLDAGAEELEHVKVERLETGRILGRADTAEWRVFSAVRALG